MSSRVVDLHRNLLLKIFDEADYIEGAARRVKQMAQEVLERGGMLHAQKEHAFITGAFVRVTKDIGALEGLQKDGVAQRGRTQT